MFAVTLAIFLTASGIFSTVLKSQLLRRDVERFSQTTYTAYEALVKTIPEKRKKSLRLELHVLGLRTASGWVSVDANALVNIPLDASIVPEPGDHIVVRGQLWEPKGPLNPEEFDYQKYLWNKGVALTSYIADGTLKIVTQEHNSWGPGLWSIHVSQWADKQFRANILDDRSYGLVKAMLLGRRDDLRSDQIDDYTTSGTVHILSVSGMHVAMIFLVMSFILGWMKRLPGGKYLYLLSITALLVFYSMVTGFPPSVQRATVMCVILVIAEVFQKKNNSVNTLGVSAFLILLLDPMALYDVGFQLSYLAMLGIFLFYKPMEDLWKPSNWLLLKTWQITALSFAAQLATFPLSIYYFHQFPFYFWLVNPFVIFFTNLLLPAAMVLLFASIFPLYLLQQFINWIVQACAYLTNVSAAVPKSLPGFLIDNLYLDKVEIMLLYLVLFGVWYMYESRQYRWSRLIAVGIILFVIYAVSTSLQTYLTPTVVFHSVPKHTVLTFKKGNTLYVSSDQEFVTDSNAYDFFINNYAIKEGVLERVFLDNVKSEKPDDLYFRSGSNGTLVNWMGKTIYIGRKIESNHDVDYHLLTKVSYPRGSELRISGRPIFLLGGDVKKRTAERWRDVVRGNNYAFHDLQMNGALLLR